MTFLLLPATAPRCQLLTYSIRHTTRRVDPNARAVQTATPSAPMAA